MGGSPASNSLLFLNQRLRKATKKSELSSSSSVLDSPPMLSLEMEVSDSDSEDISCEIRIEAKHVVFSNVHVREYAITVGDHPCCTTGCPLTLDWQYEAARTIALDTYESQRMPCRRNREQLRTTASDRTRILSEESGLSDGELRRATRQLFRARSCSARLSEKMSESFFRYEDVDQQNVLSTSEVDAASPCA